MKYYVLIIGYSIKKVGFERVSVVIFVNNWEFKIVEFFKF